MSTKDMDNKLIEEVRKRPFFYAKGQAGYRDSKLRQRAWAEIADVMELSADECYQRWRVLRDRYVKLMAKKAGNKKLNKFETRWAMYEQLAFLNPYIQPRTNTYDFVVKKSEPECMIDESLMSLPSFEYEDNCSDTLPIEIATIETLQPEPTPTTEAPEVLQQKFNELKESLATFMKNTEELLKQSATTLTADNKNEAFYRLIGGKLAELPEEEQEDTKLFIISHVFEKVKVYKKQLKSEQNADNT
ncbi:PREDICTED: uncharacterized protein LOC108360695 isoform X1 [Rhagoletis zephyria]|uniref:uncharacterized protein LOC108360695 isoform X1 n=1 Tax=Rhagoletis zephyria TaxID=28612 RepID=UPI0008117C3E|nr:PREDICTED: uncharacterized protein LOC108360695 isoform X1 [Rhagoletis zephyria]XP_017468575.1 PREDICTED: uncharacterized protein LOC108360695 isoform X1 [Rhagoletis zephyria]XP_017468576.1 PREDICTED: uncharacterized protein LOC108360695 isoform X1 [Rhagoletis zephyria]XP_017468577.1 PREDICTED: uncharacterized protein LOC108360695 isoform X1 [Rhagoletis zephyria]XP_017468578.1 PREDICTED: uncharacterized protein LOC108360695 isoform X1 [Rhagoletis zephyria]